MIFKVWTALLSFLFGGGATPELQSRPVECRISVQAPELGAEDVEQRLVVPIERALLGLAGLETLQSRSSDGLGVLWLRLRPAAGKDAALGIRERLASLPPGLPASVAPRLELGAEEYEPDVVLSLPGEGSADAARALRGRIEMEPGVESVLPAGGRAEEIGIRLDPEKLRLYSVSLDSVVAALETGSANPEEVSGLILDPSRSIRLGDVAQVSVQAREPRDFCFANGAAEATCLLLKFRTNAGSELRSPTPGQTAGDSGWETFSEPDLKFQIQAADASSPARLLEQASALAKLAAECPGVRQSLLFRPDPDESLEPPDRLWLWIWRTPGQTLSRPEAARGIRDRLESGPPTFKAVQEAERLEFRLDVEVLGPELETLASLANSLGMELSKTPGVEGALVEAAGSWPRLRFLPDPERLARFGIPTEAAERLFLAARDGIRVGGLRVELGPGGEPATRMDSISRLTLVADSGANVPLSEVGSFQLERGVSAISRSDGQRCVRLCLTLNRPASGMLRQFRQSLARIRLPVGYSIRLK